jgi:DNA topoisomerase-3
MGGRQLEPAEAETLLSERAVGPLDGFRSKLGRPFSAKLRLNDANEVEFDFGPRLDDDDAEAPDFTGQEPLGKCPKCDGRVFETPAAYVCEKAVGPDRTCDFRSGRTILQRTVERAQMEKLLATGKSDLLQFVSARTRRPFSAFLVRQPDGKVGFEFEKKERGAGARGARPMPAALKVLGKHPRDGKPVEVFAGRYGPYVKHGETNATIPDRDKVDAITLDEAVALVDDKAGRGTSVPRKKAPAPTPRKRTARPAVDEAKPVARATARKAPATTRKPPAAAKPAAGKTTKAAKKPAATRRKSRA